MKRNTCQLLFGNKVSEIRIGRWVIKWVNGKGPFPFELVIGRLKKD